jgi:hypothetical protein
MDTPRKLYTAFVNNTGNVIITARVVVRETPHYWFFASDRFPGETVKTIKKSTYDRYFESEEEAVLHEASQIQAKIQSLRDSLAQWESRLADVSRYVTSRMEETS